MNEDNNLTIRQANLDMMNVISLNQQSLDDIKALTSSKVTDQLKVFLIAQARNELSRVVKLTKFLDKLESQFMSKVDEAILDDNLTLQQYSDIINVITGLLGRSNAIISKVLNDDSLMTILNTTIYTTGESSTTSVVSMLKDQSSRERVRAVIQTIINKTEDYSPEIIIDSTEDDNNGN